MIRGYLAAFDRFDGTIHTLSGAPELAYRPLFECLNWIHAISEERRVELGRQLGELWRAHGFVRNATHHDVARALDYHESSAETDPEGAEDTNEHGFVLRITVKGSSFG